MQTALRVVTYSRVSTEDQADYGTGLDTQDIENARFTERISAAVVGRESDPGVRRTIYPAPVGTRCCPTGKWTGNALIVHRVDRLGRKAYIPQILFERIKATRGRLFTVEEGELGVRQ